MNSGTRYVHQKVPTRVRAPSHFIWPLGKSPTTPDEMNTSFGPRIDADRWDFHDGIDLPASVGTAVHAMADAIVHRAGPADKTEQGKGFGSTHVILKVVDPADGQDDLFLVYLHLDSIAEGVIPGAEVNQGDIIGTVGQEDATYPHLHFESRKGGPEEVHSVHPLQYLGYLNTANFTNLQLDRCNFYYRGDRDQRLVRLGFDVVNRREGDVKGVDIELKRVGGESQEFHVDFDDRGTIASDKGDEHAFKNNIAVEGYQKSNLKGEGLKKLRYGVLIKNIAPEFERVKLTVQDVKSEEPKSAEFSLPSLGVAKNPINSRAGFEESQTFPPPGWSLNVLSGNICRPDESAKLKNARGLLCRDFSTAQGSLIRSGLHFALPIDRAVRPMSWLLQADIKVAELQMDKGLVIHPLVFLAGNEIVAATCLRKVVSGDLFAGVMIRSKGGLFRERINTGEKGKILMDTAVRCEVELLRIGTRQTTAVLRLNREVVARINGDTISVEPDAAYVGISHRHSGLQITLHIDRLRLTEAPR